ncbi:MAG: HAMP domain-containing histidine kinase, partial [Methanomethylovorans sp.]|nr:HAMP domain-containing histidine kinase [Methanomethylovorans sp.]
YWLWIVHLFIVVVLLAFYGIYVHRYNKLLEQEVSERRNMEQKLQQYAAELQHSNEMKDLFTDILRHDLINPAGIINSYSDLLLEIETDVKKLQYLKNISRSNQKLMELIGDAASFTKLDSIDNISLEKMDLGAIITNVVESMRFQISEKNVQVSFSSSCPFVANVNPLVEQVFVNFMSNALKYGPQNGRIDIDIIDAGLSWKVCIADDGEGIPDEFKEAVFERFKRLEKGAIKGSGLGLAIAKRIVELHKGQLGVTDNPKGRGSVFWATFPKA